MVDPHVLCWPGERWLLDSFGLRRWSLRRRPLAVSIVGKEFESCVVRFERFSGVGGVVPLWFAGVFVLKVSFLGVLVLDDVLADVLTVVVAYVIAVVDTAVVKVM